LDLDSSDGEVGVNRGADEQRWRSLVSLHEEVEHEGVVVPQLASRIDGRPLQPSERALQFAEDLAFSDTWARIPDARHRRAA